MTENIGSFVEFTSETCYRDETDTIIKIVGTTPRDISELLPVGFNPHKDWLTMSGNIAASAAAMAG